MLACLPSTKNDATSAIEKSQTCIVIVFTANLVSISFTMKLAYGIIQMSWKGTWQIYPFRRISSNKNPIQRTAGCMQIILFNVPFSRLERGPFSSTSSLPNPVGRIKMSAHRDAFGLIHYGLLMHSAIIECTRCTTSNRRHSVITRWLPINGQSVSFEDAPYDLIIHPIIDYFIIMSKKVWE